MNIQKPFNDSTPLFDELNAQNRTFPDNPAPGVNAQDIERDLAEKALASISPERPLIPLEGWSENTQFFIEKINDAIRSKSRMITGESFCNYIQNAINNGYIPAYEVPKFKALRSKF
ncbi:hypothetical protein BH10BAC4_BH10BAC4_12200 [soil metagenome]